MHLINPTTGKVLGVDEELKFAERSGDARRPINELFRTS
jgi:hypothetical protein